MKKHLEPIFTPKTDLEKEISKILRNIWNPIGFHDSLPLDEYDSYIPMILELLKLKNNKEIAINSYLMHVEFNLIGLIPKKLYWKIKRFLIIRKVTKSIVKASQQQ